MKFMSTWNVRSGVLQQAADRFLAGEGQPPQGVTLLGRWHNVDCSGGYVLFETSDLTAFFESAAVWADVLEIHTVPVIEDAQAGPVLAKVFKK